MNKRTDIIKPVRMAAALIMAALMFSACADAAGGYGDIGADKEFSAAAEAEKDSDSDIKEDSADYDTGGAFGESDAGDDVDNDFEETFAETESPASSAESIDEDGTYTSKEGVALYIHTFGKLPSNYITKNEAEALGWDSKKGNLGEIAPGKSIGGSRFGNYEGLLPEAAGRKYYECDIDYDGTYRGAKRIVYSNDGLIFYTEDHYETFEQLY